MLEEKTITQLLREWGEGHDSALEELIRQTYDSLHKIAARRLWQGQPGQSLQPTAMINELYLKLIDCREYDWVNHQMFYAVCARLLRQIVADHIRHRRAHKHGGDAQRVTLDEAVNIATDDHAEELVMIDEALGRLAERDQRLARVVELRVFAEMTIEETARTLNISPDTVKRDWKEAKEWLLDYFQAKD